MPIPRPLDLMDGTRVWNDVWTEYARFDVHLRQLAKVPLPPDELRDLLTSDGNAPAAAVWPKRLSPVPGVRVFLFEASQLHDADVARATRFRSDLAAFLRLTTPLVDFASVPEGRGQGLKAPLPGMIDVCAPEHAPVRAQLVERGRTSAAWIVDKFLAAEDVVVSDREHFAAAVRRWGVDPCDGAAAATTAEP